MKLKNNTNDKNKNFILRLTQKFFMGVASYIFIILGLIFIILFLLIPENNTSELNQILKNLCNALGSILIVGGIFEIAFKEKFIKEVSNNFVKTIFLKSSTLDNFKEEELEQINKSIQNKLLNNNRTNICSNKILTMINDSFYQMAKGTHNKTEFNTYFQYFNATLYVKKKEETKKENNDIVEIEYDLKYEIRNNKKNQDEIEVGIFTKRFFPLNLSLKDDCLTQELTHLTIKKDGESKDYANEIKEGLFKEITINKEEKDMIKIQEEVKRQIQLKNKDAEYEEFKVSFKNTMIIEKKIKIVTLFDDIHYSHIFSRPTLNYSIQYYDENVSVKDKDYLTLRLFSGLNKKTNDRIHPNLKGQLISLNISDGILLPGEGISIVALRK